MGRPSSKRPRSASAIEADIADEIAVHESCSADLRDALIAGEDTRPYRNRLAEIGQSIEALRRQLAAVHGEEQVRRRALLETNAKEIAAESFQRHAAFLATIAVPVLPSIVKEFQK